jgi:hypothetical protein
LGHQMNILFL